MKNVSKKVQYRINRRGASALGGLLTFVITLAIAGAAVYWGPNLVDKVLAANYTPTEQIKNVNDRIRFTARGKELFYASTPSIEAQETFNQHCQSVERTTAMLGCYFQRKIYLYDVRNHELDGAVEVTAAHEMLHAAYDRLNMFERNKVDDMIRDEYTKVKDIPEIKSLMEYYSKAEPGEEINELHSIIGTTVANINPDLETYYARYFKDRQYIVELNVKYSEVFRQVETRASELSDYIQAEGAALETALARYDSDRKQLEIDITTFNDRASSGGFPNQSAFNAARSVLVQRSNGLNTQRDNLNQRVAMYNEKVEQLKDLSVKVRELNKSINGVETPPVAL